MTKQAIQTDNAPQAIGPYSQAIRTETMIYFSGQIPLNPVTMQLVSGDIKAQTVQVLTNMEEVCKAAGGSLDKIVKLTIYLTSLDNFPVVNEVMKDYFKKPYPARTTIEVSGLPKGAQIEIEAIMPV